MLTTCTISITGREGIPKVSYSTALDIFLLMCFTFVFAALVEYAGVNYFTKSGNVENPVDEDEMGEIEVGASQFTCLLRASIRATKKSVKRKHITWSKPLCHVCAASMRATKQK